MCYKDMTWCCSPNCSNECGRQFTQEDRVKAIKWWGDDDFPLAVSEFCDKEGKVKE